MLILNLAYLTVYQIPADLIDDDYNYIIFQFQMNYTADSFRKGYFEDMKEKESKASDELLRELGYSDSDILNKR